jgi:hypothetical protein
MRTATPRVSGSNQNARNPANPGGRRLSERYHSVYVDFEDGLALIVPTVGADAMRHLRVITLRTGVHGHAFRLEVGAALPLTLFRSAFLWNGHRLLVL